MSMCAKLQINLSKRIPLERRGLESVGAHKTRNF